MQTTLPQLRPKSLGDLLDEVFRLYRNNFLTFIGIAAILQMPMILLQLVLTTTLGRRYTSDLLQLSRELPAFNPRTDTFADLRLGNIIAFLVVTLLLALLQGAVIQQLINGALANAIAARYMNRQVSILGAYQMGSGTIVSLILVGLMVIVIGAAFGAVLFGIYIGGVFFIVQSLAGRSGGGGIAAVIGGLIGIFILVLFLLILFSMLMLRFLFVTQAVVLERCSPIAALRRSWRLMRGSFWRVLGIFLLLIVLVLVLVNLPVALVNYALTLTIGNPADPLQNYTLLQSILLLTNYAAQILVLPLQLISYTLLYYDLRVRKEGYDLQVMAEQQLGAEAQ